MNMFKRIDHIEIVTAEPERAVRFYTEVLGFKVRSRVAVPGGGPQLVYLDLGGTMVELITYAQTPPPAAAAGLRLGYSMMALEVEDMDQALAQLKAQGVEPSWGPVKRPSYARAEIRDPDGNAIELRQWLTPANRARS